MVASLRINVKRIEEPTGNEAQPILLVRLEQTGPVPVAFARTLPIR
jgi:hypothetical protein